MAFGSPQWMYASGEDFTIAQSLKFEPSRDPTLTRTFGTSTSLKKFTFSCWFKRSNVTASVSQRNIFSVGTDGNNYAEIAFHTLGYFYIHDYSGGYKFRYYNSSILYRDPSAWIHLIVAVDTTQATASQRVRIYFNGNEITTWNVATDPAQNSDLGWFGSNGEHTIGAQFDETGNNFDGYLAELHYIDGIQYAPADFGETGDYGEWKPKEVSGLTYGTNGFYLPFKNDYTVEGFSAVTYGGNASSNHYIGGAGFQPDLVWLKNRETTQSHAFFDSIRGVTKYLSSNSSSADYTDTTSLLAFDTDGFSVGSEDVVNKNAETYVSWNWDMGANSPTGFGCVTYKGNDGTNSISGVGFQPDLVWTKGMDISEHHCLFDTVRGHTVNIKPNLTDAEAAQSKLDRFGKDGFTLSTNSNEINDASSTYVAWCWDMGGSDATNTSGSINSTVRANTDKGQSIVTWTGTGAAATIGHGLSSTPELIILKNRSESHHWGVFHKDLNDGTDSGDYNLFLNLGATEAINENYWNGTEPTSSVFSVGNIIAANGSADKMVAYCFHSVTGYSSIGSYTGNGNATGPSVTTGFRPAFVMIKKVGIANWFIFDNVRSDSIVTDINEVLQANHTNTEAQNGTTHKIDFNATGFQLKASGGDTNDNNVKYRYIAFAGGADAISTVNTTGTIDSRVKASTTYGQSMVSWTGTGATGTVGTGLTSDAELVIVKSRNTTDNWSISTTVIDSSVDGGYFNSAGAFEDWSARVDPSSATSNTIGVYDWDDGNKLNSDLIAYAFHSVTGYSKIGSYTGDGGSSHTITTGFKPAFVMLKNTSTGARPWVIFDGVRSDGLVWNDYLKANESEAETVDNTNRKITVSDTGFTLGIDQWVNQNESVFVYIAFADKREYAYWLDQSGNNNDWTSNNLTESDISVDTPMNNFPTLNALNYVGALSEGNLAYTAPTSDSRTSASTMASSSGKWYAEVLIGSTGTNWVVGVASAKLNALLSADKLHNYTGGNASYLHDGNKSLNGTQTSYGATYTTGDIIGIALDVGSGTVTFYKNNASQGSITLPTSNDTAWQFALGSGTTGASHSYNINFGQDSSFAGKKTAQGNQDSNDIGDFYYTPPTDYLALCTSNLPDVTITPSEHFNAVLYTGNATADHAVTTGFQPDFVWLKNRTDGHSHRLIDAVRGDNKVIYSNNTDAEEVITSGSDDFNFTSTGFTLPAADGSINNNGKNYVSWNWKAGGSGSSNSDGNVTTTVSANTDAGFSIVTWTGDGSGPNTYGHGLDLAPEFVTVKRRNDTGVWYTWFEGITSNYAVFLNDTNAQQNDGNLTAVSATTITAADGIMTDSNNFVAYCWHSVDGYSKFGTYTGNSNADGTFVYTGFKPAFVMIKKTDGDKNWSMYDNKRDSINPNTKQLYANLGNVEYDDATYTAMDFVSNGFKWRTNNTGENVGNYIYLAFAETPFKYSNAE